MVFHCSFQTKDCGSWRIRLLHEELEEWYTRLWEENFNNSDGFTFLLVVQKSHSRMRKIIPAAGYTFSQVTIWGSTIDEGFQREAWERKRVIQSFQKKKETNWQLGTAYFFFIYFYCTFLFISSWKKLKFESLHLMRKMIEKESTSGFNSAQMPYDISKLSHLWNFE